MDYNYNVHFIGEYFSMTVRVEADNDDEAEEKAVELIESYYDWDIRSAASVSIEVEKDVDVEFNE